MSTDFLTRYDHMADRAANEVIANYSTSFGLATQLLAPRVRRDIRNLYAVVRIADEIVDGTADQAGHGDVDKLLDTYEQQVRQSPLHRFHTDPVIHAFAQTARRCQLDDAHLAGFFRSMRTDLHKSTYDATGLDEYIYGSAEVIGLMCLAIFFAEDRAAIAEEEYAELEAGARSLGAAFQKINFLRDYAEDSTELGRAYFPGTETTLTEDNKDAIVADIRSDLEHAWTVIPRLPLSARMGVVAAANFFEELTELADATPVAELEQHRISVPSTTKARIIAGAVVQAPRLKGSH
ncbi:putative phytoene synthase [Corynebacterium renale]|uniref:Phytoene/squalene synthetase n=2 Tax=Corynebacterium renale TaxID=1724 RepID=A0A2A9DPL3_9CORY|nr:phytoene/squalene synthase family protein [Corynebacterium renale]PFG27922.1 phytoene/squalene synthetase [Corynebacterium renale]SQG63358.1 putative phytoene synthase [Corynebacterium renale]SQI21867.1 putative phytoene synthase [Corynebacterium renale]STC99733.1 putative phytoene synthase [Corynebacterium renale]